MVPEIILDSIDQNVAKIASIKRFIKTARRRFRPKSPNDVDHYLLLASCLYVMGDEQSAIALLEFLDENTGEYTCGRVDLAGSLAVSRLMLAYIYEQRNEMEKFHQIMSREGLCHSQNMNNVEPEYKNLIQECRIRASEDFEFHENQDDVTRTYLLKFCCGCMLELIKIKGRLDEIRHTISDDDVADLLEDIEIYRKKFVYYLSSK